MSKVVTITLTYGELIGVIVGLFTGMCISAFASGFFTEYHRQRREARIGGGQ